LGFKDGLVRKIIGLIGLIAGIGLGIEFASSLGNFLKPFFNDEEYLASLIAGILIFSFTVLIASIIKRIVHPLDKVNRFINQLLGGIIGIIQIIFFLSSVFLFLNIFGFPGKMDRENSLFYNSTLDLIPNSIDLIIGHHSKASELIKNYIEKKDLDTMKQSDTLKIK